MPRRTKGLANKMLKAWVFSHHTAGGLFQQPGTTTGHDQQQDEAHPEWCEKLTLKTLVGPRDFLECLYLYICMKYA